MSETVAKKLKEMFGWRVAWNDQRPVLRIVGYAKTHEVKLGNIVETPVALEATVLAVVKRYNDSKSTEIETAKHFYEQAVFAHLTSLGIDGKVTILVDGVTIKLENVTKSFLYNETMFSDILDWYTQEKHWHYV